MLVDVSYFVAGPRHILNATIGIGVNEVNVAITNAIAYHQLPFLCELLGVEKGRELDNYLNGLDNGEDPDEKLDAICRQISHPFADYVFYHIIRNNTQATMTGLVRLKCANEYIDPINRQVQVWNGMVNRLTLSLDWFSSRGIELNPDTELLTPINAFNL